jgi:hypothetical protein
MSDAEKTIDQNRMQETLLILDQNIALAELEKSKSDVRIKELQYQKMNYLSQMREHLIKMHSAQNESDLAAKQKEYEARKAESLKADKGI